MGKFLKFLNEARYDAGKVYYCPKCKQPSAVADYLGWRTCKDCGWEERLPSDLKEVVDNEEN
jgi:RNase P subunit RPR2